MAPSVVADVSGTQPVLSEDCMMVGVRLSNMSFKVKDDEVSAELVKQYDAEPNAFLFTKNRFYKEDISPVVSANGAIRAWVKKWTFKLPQATDDNGQSKAPRLIVVSSMPTAMEELGVLLDDRDEAINVLLNNYDSFIEKGQKLMGGLFNREDYPPLEEVRSKFSHNVALFGIPTVGNIDAGKYTDEMRIEEQDRQDAMVKKIHSDLLKRFIDKVGNMADILSKKAGDTRTQDSLIDHVSELVEVIIPKCNLGDPALDELCNEARELCQYNAEQLKTVETVRERI
ncbi:uncharacterized protein METZ01_LOCUS286456, partial [marine metagenome]